MPSPNPNLMSKGAAAEKGSSLAISPPSLANLLEEGGPRPCVMRTTIKSINFVSTNSSFLPTGREDKVGWGDLPLELWGEIGKCLLSQFDILCFRSVCKKWRASLPLPTRFPLWVPPLPRDVGIGKLPCIVIPVSIYRCRGDREILIFEEVDQGGRFIAFWTHHKNFGTERRVVKFDGFKKPSIEHWVHRLSFVYKAYHLRIGIPSVDSHNKRIPGHWGFLYNPYASKVVIISSNATDGVNPSYARAYDLTVVALLRIGSMKGRLALLRLGGSSQNQGVWDTDFCNRVFIDIATYRGQLCAIEPSGAVLLMDYNSLRMTRVSPPWPVVRGMRKKYLYEACGNLYLADLSNLGRIVQYKLSLRLQKWSKAQVSHLYLISHRLFPIY